VLSRFRGRVFKATEIYHPQAQLRPRSQEDILLLCTGALALSEVGARYVFALRAERENGWILTRCASALDRSEPQSHIDLRK